MGRLETALQDNREAVTAMLVAVERSAALWATPPRPGKWSPSQIVEHVARALEESAKVVAGEPSKFATFPGVLRPLVRGLFFNRVLRNKRFPKARTTRPMNPDTGPATVVAGRERLEAALSRFDRACRTHAAGPVRSTIFGDVSIEDYARFQALHTRHHCRQIPGA